MSKAANTPDQLAKTIVVYQRQAREYKEQRDELLAACEAIIEDARPTSTRLRTACHSMVADSLLHNLRAAVAKARGA